MNKAIVLMGLILILGCYHDLDENDLEEENLRLSEEILHQVTEIESYLNVTYLIDELKLVDNSTNLMQRLKWKNKTYIIFRYLGDCTSEEYIDLRTNTC